MSNLKEIRKKSTQIYHGKLLNVWRDEVELPNGASTIREYIIHPGAVVMIPILDNGDLMLVRQFRYPLKQTFLELPAGKIDLDEPPLDTAQRELEEEIGFRANKMTLLTEIHPCIGYSDEQMWIYLAEELIPSKRDTDDDEFLELVPLSLPKCLSLIWSGEITDVKTIIGILWANHLQTSKV